MNRAASWWRMAFLTGCLTGWSAVTAFAAEREPPGSVGTYVRQAQDLLRQGRLLDAQKQYAKAVEEIDWYALRGWKIRKASEDLNIKILFSKAATVGSKFHRVEEGEALFDIAKKYGTTVELLRRSNGIKGDKILSGSKLKVMVSKFSVSIDKSRNELVLEKDGKPFKHYRVATGRQNKTPVGKFKITTKVTDPTWYKKVGLVIPPGVPENHLGTRWLGFDKPSYGMHGTVEPESIGRQASSGCIRMLNQDVEELYDILPLGTQVTIQN